jgi:NADP-reducing hydrogenase subunit HndD
MKKNKKQYHFVEFMACTGGCINGGGQPIHPAKVQDNVDIRGLRAKSLYEIDSNSEKRKSHLNPLIMGLYEEWLEEPGSKKAHHLLHTKYAPRKYYENN